MHELVGIRGFEMSIGNSKASGSSGRTFPQDAGRLLLLHRDGDPEAFAQLVGEYRAPVYSYLVRCGVAEADQDDLFQSIFIKIHGAAGSYQNDRSLHPWLFTIVANTVRTYHRKKRVRDLIFTEPEEREQRAREASSEEKAVANQTAAWLEAEIPKLPLAQREVLILVCIEDLPQKEVAAILRLNLNTVKTYLRRARLTLVGKLARRNASRKGEVGS